MGSDGVERNTTVSIIDEAFHVNGRPTYEGRRYRDMLIEGLLLNIRVVNGIFDDANPETRSRWAYPDTGIWDPDRNTQEFVAAMPTWKSHGVMAFTVNLQGGSPEAYSLEQPWDNSAFSPDGDLKPEYLARLKRILDRAGELGMVVLVGLFYFGQDERLKGEQEIKRGVENAARWILSEGYTNVMLEICNECDVPQYEHLILWPHRVHELIAHAKGVVVNGRRLLVGTSYRGGSIPGERVVAESDFVLMHGNGVRRPSRIGEMVDVVRSLPTYTPKPILFNEDDHFGFDQPECNMLAAISRYASWGFFDPGPAFHDHPARGDYVNGFQAVPVNWGISTERKRAFFAKVKEITGA